MTRGHRKSAISRVDGRPGSRPLAHRGTGVRKGLDPHLEVEPAQETTRPTLVVGPARTGVVTGSAEAKGLSRGSFGPAVHSAGGSRRDSSAAQFTAGGCTRSVPRSRPRRAEGTGVAAGVRGPGDEAVGAPAITSWCAGGTPGSGNDGPRGRQRGGRTARRDRTHRGRAGPGRRWGQWDRRARGGSWQRTPRLRQIARRSEFVLIIFPIQLGPLLRIGLSQVIQVFLVTGQPVALVCTVGRLKGVGRGDSEGRRRETAIRAVIGNPRPGPRLVPGNVDLGR